MRVAIVALLTLGAAAPAMAQPARAIDLGDEVSVQRRWIPCGLVPDDAALCALWEPTGFSFGAITDLAFARTFARVSGTGRIVASIRFPDGHSTLLFTDDLGATWRDADWPSHDVANAIAFDRRTSFGVAVGDGGRVWSTTDGGASWRERRSGSGIVYTDVAVLGRIAVFAETNGTVWRSRDGGFARDLVTESPGATLTLERDAILVTTGRRAIRVLRDGSLVR